VNRFQRALVPRDFAGVVEVVWNWLPQGMHDAIALVSNAEAAALRTALGIDDATFVFGSVGRIVREKGMDALVRAFQLAFPRGDERVALIIVGSGRLEETIQRMAATDRRIFLAGATAATTDVARFYRAFDAYVSAARFEPFGLSILEAMEAGLPLVLTRTDGPREFVTDSRTLWADRDDDDGLAGQLAAACANGRQRYRYDLARFSAANAVVAIDAFYSRVIISKR
jgi:glycosyltransferase involved in cell wall biosynthesis